MDIMTRNLMKDKVFVVRKKVQAEVERVMEGAMEQVLECLQLSIKTVMKEKKKEMKRLTKSAMREMELLAMEPMIEQVKKQEIEPAMEPPMETVKKQEMKRAKKKRDLESTFSTQDAPAERNVNQSWIKCKKFRLGARVLQNTSYIGQVRIKEAITEAFAVRDYCSKRAKKHDLPSLKDEVWHLKNVKKGVGHFNEMYTQDAKKLREVLKDCTDQDWKEIVKDASRVVDDESPVLHQELVYAYSPCTITASSSGKEVHNPWAFYT
ncbi:hypothetical protein Ddye_025948 [Dipteronia dyeriana]|uniref:Calmodulin binding protein-like N-terminal domain-containing protein n=1 Tax=Dipteronia dyeriana TaxID=168575 RepID=A0AAD9TM36_9ROSI|nr:hypothetical protein Ddye_025948 [Dipteronia dyeriana]